MSLIKKPHSKIRISSMKARLLALDAYLDQHYTFRCEKAYQGWWGKLCALADRDEAEKWEKAHTDESWWDTSGIYGSCPAGLDLAIQQAIENHARNNSSLYLMRLIEAKGADHVTVDKRANLDRKLFSKIKTNPTTFPAKRPSLRWPWSCRCRKRSLCCNRRLRLVAQHPVGCDCGVLHHSGHF